MRHPRRSPLGALPLHLALFFLALTLLGSPAAAFPQKLVDVAPGQEAQPRPVVKSVDVQGNRRYEASALVAALGQAVGEPLLTEAELSRGIKVLFDTFRVRASTNFDARQGILYVNVTELALDLEPRFSGNVSIDVEELLEWAGLGAREELYLYQAPRIERRLVQRYREEGFAFAEVEVVDRRGGTDPDTGEYVAPDVIFRITEGPKVRVRSVEVKGNDSLPDKGFFFKSGLRRLAGTELRAPRLGFLFAKSFVREKLDADILAMRQVYRDLGYLDAVVELERLEFNDEHTWVTIHIAVDEGEPYRVGTIDLVGIERVRDPEAPRGYREMPAELVFPREELLALLELAPGTVFENRIVRTDEVSLRDRYGEQGYISHPTLPRWDAWEFLEPQLVFDEEEPVVHVTYRLAQGHQQFIREVLISGNLHTQDRVVRREITVAPGEVANPVEIERSRARLTSRGYFVDDRDPAHLPPRYRFLETGDPNYKDIEYIVEEGSVLTFHLTGGVSSNTGVFGQISLRMINFDATNLPHSPWSVFEDISTREAFHGAGQSLLIQASPGTEITRYNMSFTEPDLFGLNQDRIGGQIAGRRTLQRIDSHDEERNEVEVQFSRQLSADSSVFLGYQLGTVEVSDLDQGGEPTLGSPLAVPLILKQQEGEFDLSGISFGYRFARIDNSLSPRNGIRFNFENSLFDKSLGSDFEFLRSELRFDWYDEFDEDPDLVSDRYHLGLRATAGIPFGDTDEVPYTERSFVGGQRTMRGFDYRGVGPNELGFPLGGTTMLYGTLEYRRPLVKQTQPGTYREIEALQGGLFLDAVILDPEDLSLDADELRVSAGFLFGITFPIPITFSFGFPLRKGDGDETQVLGFDIGI